MEQLSVRQLDVLQVAASAGQRAERLAETKAERMAGLWVQYSAVPSAALRVVLLAYWTAAHSVGLKGRRLAAQRVDPMAESLAAVRAAR